jgi:hypothetical protein
MDVHRFDTLVRTCSTPGSRRRLLGLLGSTSLGALLATSVDHDADARNNNKNKKCKKKCGECQQCKKGRKDTCKPKPDGTLCSTGSCNNGACGCPADQVCVISEICCPDPLVTSGNTELCESTGNLCSCTGGTTLCIFGGGEFGDCCEAGETCDPDDGCVA